MIVNKFNIEYDLLFYFKNISIDKQIFNKIGSYIPISEVYEFEELTKFIFNFSSTKNSEWCSSMKRIYNSSRLVSSGDTNETEYASSLIRFQKDIIKKTLFGEKNATEYFEIFVSPIKEDYFIYSISRGFDHDMYPRIDYKTIEVKVGLEYIEDFNKVLIRYLNEKISLL